MRLASVVVMSGVVFGSACGPPGNTCSVVVATAFDTGEGDVPLVALLGEATTVRLTDSALLVCDGLARAPSSVRTTVEDGQGAAVMHSATEPSATLSRGSSVSVTFTPTRVGQHLLTASFEPALGVARRTLTVVEPRTWDGAPVFPTDAGCTRAYAAHGGLLCSSGGGWQFWTADGGRELGDATCMARPSTSGLWVSCAASTSWFQVDGGLVSAAATGAGYGAVRALTVVGERALLATDTQLHELDVDAGFIVRRRVVSHSTPSRLPSMGLVPVAELGTVMTSNTTTAYYVPWSVSGARVLTLDALPVWVDDGALFVADSAGRSLQRLHYDFSPDLPTRSFAPPLSVSLTVGPNRKPGLPQASLFSRTLVLDAKRLVWVGLPGLVDGSNGVIAWRTNADRSTQVLTLSP